jgi:hypothetical protein
LEEWYDESSASPSLSPATKKRHHDEMENEFTTDSDLMSGQEGKTPSELICIPLFSPGIVWFFSVIQLAPVGISVRLLILGWTYGTYLHY